MILEGMHEKDIFTESYPFRLVINSEADFHYPKHWHTALELVYPVENECLVSVNNDDFSLKPREILIIAGGDLHGFHAACGVILLQFDAGFLDSFVHMNAVMPYLNYTRKIAQSEDLHRELEGQILKIIDEYGGKPLAYQLSLHARVLDIIVLLSRDFTKRSNSRTTAKSSAPFNLERLNRAFEFIEQNYMNEIRLCDAAKASGFSVTHFSRIFKKITGKNFHCYLNQYRIKKAERLLMNSDMNIAEIAFSSGFNSVVTFNRTFKEIKGCTPSAYKNLRYQV